MRSQTINYPFAAIHLILLLAPGILASTYTLEEDYSGDHFFDGFDFFTDKDPTNGFVTYIDQYTATSLNLTHSRENEAAYIGVDSTSILNPNGPGRRSVRITTKKAWTHGLFITDITHMPGGICGTWPAFWSHGPDWPSSGEIDIIEGVNSQKENLMSLHTSPGCTVAGDLQLGTLQTSNCDSSINYNSGCASSPYTKPSYGEGFNGNGGGVFATEWTKDYIRIWFFPRGDIPPDVIDGTPDPASWGLPEVNFQGDCDIEKKFKDHRLIFDTTFCGDWGNAGWSLDPVCKNTALTCAEFVADNPEAFIAASWSINYVKVFKHHIEVDSLPNAAASSSQASICSKKASASKAKRAAPPQISKPTTSITPTPPTKEEIQVDFVDCVSFGTAIKYGSVPTYSDAGNMTPSACMQLCQPAPYGALFEGYCICLNSALPAYVKQNGRACNFACPGDPSQSCGGAMISEQLGKREVPNFEGKLFSLYKVANRNPGISNSSTSSTHSTIITDFPLSASETENEYSSAETYDECDSTTSTLSTPTTSITPASQSFAYAMGGGAQESQFYTTVITTTYIDTCSCPANTLTTYTLTHTTKLCSCAPTTASMSSEPRIPMYTTTRKCVSCGDSGVVTVTVPFPLETCAEEVIVVKVSAEEGRIYGNGTRAGERAKNGTVVFVEVSEGSAVGVGWALRCGVGLVLGGLNLIVMLL